MKTPRSSRSWNHRVTARPSAFPSGISGAISVLPMLPVLDRANQPIERSDAQHDHQIAAHLRVAQAEARVHDEGVADALLADHQRFENRTDALDAQMRDRERHLDLEQI